MKLYGVLVAQNEGDIIENTLDYLKSIDIYDEIYFYDLDSTDDTYSIAIKFSKSYPKLKPVKLEQVYTQRLRFELLKKHSSKCIDGDWLAIIDADEFYVDNPLDFVLIAERENATCINTYQIQFYFTDKDLRDFDNEDISLPIYYRRKYYLIDWSEPRFYKFSPAGKPWISTSKPGSMRLLNRHYQYRTPDQINTRIKTRLETREKGKHIHGGSKFNQVFSSDWEDYIVSHKSLHMLEDNQFKFGIPYGVSWKDYFNTNNHTGTLHPQLAEAFMKEKVYYESIMVSKISENEKNILNNSDCIVTIENGIVTIQDRYGELVLNDIKRHLSSADYLQAIYGLLVIFRYCTRVINKHTYRKLSYIWVLIKDTIWNYTNFLKRFILGKSTGSIYAVPNPIEASGFHIEGVGKTGIVCTWSNAKKVEVHIDSPNGKTLKRNFKSGVMSKDKKVENNSILFLQDVSDGLPLSLENTLAKVTVKVFQSNEITI